MEELKIKADYHTHTVYSHGKGTVEENVKKAVELGLKTIAITDHGLKHFIFGMSAKSMVAQRKEIEILREKYTEIKILCGIESNLMGISGRIDLSEQQRESLDLVLCGFHKPVFADKISDYYKLFYNSYSHSLYKPTKSQIARNTKAYINLVKNNKIDIVTHINYHLRVDCYEVAKVCEDYGTVLELSSRHLDLTDEDYEGLLKTNCMFAVNSDAHKVENIGNCHYALQQVAAHGIDHTRIINYTEDYKFRSQN